MQVVHIVAVLGVIGALLLLSANTNLEGQQNLRDNSLRVDAASSAGAYRAWAMGQARAGVPETPVPEYSNRAVRSALHAAATTPPFADGTKVAVAVAPRTKACAPGCEQNGVCNSELGRCDCPPYVGGDDCSKPLLPACAAAVGLTTVAPAPCVIDTLSLGAPVSCECLMGCEAIGLMGVRECYVMDPSNRTVATWVQRQIHMRGLAPNHEYWESSLKGAHAESVKECSGHGIFAPRMPSAGAPSSRAPKRCWCHAGFTGSRCESSTNFRPIQACLNGCSGRGKCVRNWCHCSPGYYGVDCSLGAGAGESKAVPLPPPIGAQTDAKAPKVYIYELPPRFNSWMHAGDGGWWQDFDLWGEDVIIHRRALRSLYRVTDPEAADFFLVPVWVSSAMWQMNWGFRDLLPTGVRTVGEAADYVRQTWPYFDRKGGADHLWVFGHDQGAWRIRQKLPLIAKGIFISPFGGGPSQRGGHVPGQDIVCPSVVQSTVLGLLNHAGRRKKEPTNLAFFQGKLNLHIPYEYSFGIRQGLFKAHRNTPRIVVKEGHEANREAYFQNMCGSKFCVAAAGFGFSTRAYEASAAGCVPLIMQDGIEQAYEELLPWFLFSLRLNNSLAQISGLKGTLEKIPESVVTAMRSHLYCVWPRFLWLRHDPGARTPLPDATRLLKFDAFESIAWTLRKRLHHDINWPADWDEGCAEVGKYFASQPTGSGNWKPWANYEYAQKRD
jgi:hypothetical protein